MAISLRYSATSSINIQVRQELLQSSVCDPIWNKVRVKGLLADARGVEPGRTPSACVIVYIYFGSYIKYYEIGIQRLVRRQTPCQIISYYCLKAFHASLREPNTPFAIIRCSSVVLRTFNYVDGCYQYQQSKVDSCVHEPYLDVVLQ